MRLLKWGAAVYQSADYHVVVYPDLHPSKGRKGVLFGPLAFTKTYAMAGAALLAIVVILILMGY